MNTWIPLVNDSLAIVSITGLVLSFVIGYAIYLYLTKKAADKYTLRIRVTVGIASAVILGVISAVISVLLISSPSASTVDSLQAWTSEEYGIILNDVQAEQLYNTANIGLLEKVNAGVSIPVEQANETLSVRLDNFAGQGYILLNSDTGAAVEQQ